VTVVLDTNTVMYFLGGRLAHPLPDDDYIVSVITQIELLSYPLLSSDDEQQVLEFLASVTVMDLTAEIRDAAIRLRRNHRLKLPDSIIAGTAVSLDVALLTNDRRLANTPDLHVTLTALKS
jgi:predicted nucleic acid-binding protein